MKKMLATLAVILFPSLAFGAEVGVISESSLGFGSAQSINGTPTTNAIRMSGSAAADPYGNYYTRLTLIMQIVWGTTTTMNVKCKVSGDGTNYSWIQRCTSAATHDCGDRVWQWESTDGTTPSLDLEANWPYIICQFDDPGAGNGTIQVHAIRGR